MEEFFQILAQQFSLGPDSTIAAIIYVLTVVIPAFVFVLTIVVFFHELGHFLVARWCGVTVEAFSIGFGPEIFGFNDKHGTRWRVAWIPLGGYVKFIDDQNAASIPDQEAIKEMTPEQQAGALQTKPLWQRSAVVAAGPIASFLLGIVIFAMAYVAYGEQYLKPVAGKILENSPAAKAGFKPGDEILAVDGTRVKAFRDVKIAVNISGEKELAFTVLRDGKEIVLKGTAEVSKKRDPLGNKVRLMGIQASGKKEHLVRTEVGVISAVGLSIEKTYTIVSTTLRYLWNVITLKAAPDQLSGPVKIAETAGKVASYGGIWPLLQFAAYLSVAIGLFNLFPIPILDGGHLMFNLIEAVQGRPLSAKTQDIAASVGFALLILLMVFVTHQDIFSS